MTWVLPAALVVALAAAVVLLDVHRRTLRRVVLGTVDPRPLALFRIAMGLCLLSYLVEIAPLSTYLFSDEGLLPSEAVPEVYGRGALHGYGEGVRASVGFAGVEAIVRHLAHGRWSLLYFWDSPAFVYGYLVVMALWCVALTVGWRSRTCAVVAWLMLCGLLRRGDAHWGGEQVFLGLLFPLMLARSGAAFGVDSWRRHRRLAREGRLDRRDGAEGGRGAPPSSEHPRGLAAIYPRVPAWPQALLVVQLTLCYFVNGWAKAGPTWTSGETLRLAVHLDRYARIDWHWLAQALGPWPFRLGTWSVMWWERLFPLLVVGLWLRAVQRVDAPGLVGRARTLSRAALIVLAGALFVASLVPGALAKAPAVAQDRGAALGITALAMVLLVLVGPRLGAWGRRWALRLTDPRWWLAFGVLFHLSTLVLMEIGAFASLTISAYLICGAGPWVVSWVQAGARMLVRRGVPVPQHLTRDRPVRAEDPSLPHLHRDRAELPAGAITIAGIVVLLGAVLALRPATGAIGWWHVGWSVAAVLLIVLGRRAQRRAPEGVRSWPLAYGPAGRLGAGGVLAYHLVALLAWQVPTSPALPWQHDLRRVVNPWMELTFSRQLWSMFAPNGPTKNRTVRTKVLDADGVVHDLRTEQQHPQNMVRPYVRHDRRRKVQESVGGYRKWLAPWHARYLCRQWAFEHDGGAPAKVRLERVEAPFAPMEVDDAMEWFWAQATAKTIVEVECATEPFAQLSPEVRARHDLPEASPDELRYAWKEPPPRPDPYEPLWVLWGLGLAGVVIVWSRRAPS